MMESGTTIWLGQEFDLAPLKVLTLLTLAFHVFTVA